MKRLHLSTAWLAGIWLLVLWAATVSVAQSDEFGQGDPPFKISARRERVVKASTHRSQYSIVMGGTVDMDNSMTRHYGRVKIAFQPNLSLEIANTGDTLVTNPRVVINGKRNWWSMEELLEEILEGAQDDQERALLIWDFVRKHRYHDRPLFTDDELHDPVKFLGVYGAGLCDDSAAVGCSLLYHAGINAAKHARNPQKRHLHGHVMCEAYLAGNYQFLDIDENVFYLDRENERIVSGDELARDHDLAKREPAYGPIFQGWRRAESAAALFGTDDGASFGAVAGHRLEMALRPGEKIVYRWDNRGKVASDNRFGLGDLRFFGNSRQIYSPRLDDYKTHVVSARDIRIVAPLPGAEDARLAGASQLAQLVYEMKSPYLVCGGQVEASFHGLHASDRFEISLSLDGQQWKEVWSGSGDGPLACQVDLDPHLALHQRPAKYRYLVRISLSSAESGSASLARLTMATDLMAAPLSLPRLSLGTNRVVYTDSTPSSDETSAAHEVTITHRWQESDKVHPAAPPAEPLFPKPGSLVRASTFSFRWPESGAADRYHLQVSRRADMKLPYRPAFDVVVDHAEHGSPYTGMFSPDTDYFWRVRTRNRQGVWGRWSDVWQFRWEGPRVAIHLQHHIQPNGEITISWLPNPRGSAVHHYDVYGSDERGFSVSKTPYDVKGIGRQEANFLAQTRSTEMLVVSPTADHANMNRCFYRVVAVDRHGVESGSSDYVELPHPYIYAPRTADAVVGRELRFELKTLRSIGDLQHRYADRSQQFWEREEYAFELVQGPAWLQLDSQRAMLAGTPRAEDEGTFDVEVVAKRRYPYEVPTSAERGGLFQKTAPRFQATHRHALKIRVAS